MKTSTIEKANPIPLKEQLRQWIRGRIQNGELKTEERIPSINSLAKDFDMSRETVRLSLESMVKQGILNPRHGKGYYVAPREKRIMRVGLLGKIDGIYIRPIYEGLQQELNSHASILLMDSHRSDLSLSTLIQNLAYHQSVDRLLVVPVRGKEAVMEQDLAPFRRYFKLAWLDRAPQNTTDATFLCDYEKCVALALAQFHKSNFRTIYYFSRNPEDNSVFTTMRLTFTGEAKKFAESSGITGEWQDILYTASQSKGPLGILTETDTEAVFLQTRLIANGIKIPDQVSIISCDNTPLTDLVKPAITAIEPGFMEVGRQAGIWIKRDILNVGIQPPTRFVPTPILIHKDSCTK